MGNQPNLSYDVYNKHFTAGYYIYTSPLTAIKNETLCVKIGRLQKHNTIIDLFW